MINFQVAGRYTTFQDACVHWSSTNAVDPVTLSWGISCQRSCGPPPECRIGLEAAAAADIQRMNAICTECTCTWVLFACPVSLAPRAPPR